MKSGRPSLYPDMPYKGHRQLRPHPGRLEAKYMMDCFDVSITEIRQLCEDVDPYSKVIGSDKEAGAVLKRSMNSELDMMMPFERTANFMQLAHMVDYMNQCVEDEQTWMQVGRVVPPKRKRGQQSSELPNIAEESEDSDDDLNDLAGAEVEQRKRMIAPMLRELDKSIWFR
jgi:hypothetical protein